MAKYSRRYINLKTGKIGRVMTGYDTTDMDEWQKRAIDSQKDGSKMSILANQGRNGKFYVREVIIDYADGKRSVTKFGRNSGNKPKNKK